MQWNRRSVIDIIGALKEFFEAERPVNGKHRYTLTNLHHAMRFPSRSCRRYYRPFPGRSHS